MIGYCVSDKYCQYKSDTGYCGYTGGCVQENSVTIKVPTKQCWSVSKVVDISTNSIEAIADAVVKKLRGEECKNGKWIDQDQGAFYTTECSECHKVPLLDAYGDYVFSDFCPNCGADMRGEK